MKILVMGGTRFVGKSLVQKLLKQNHVIDVFTRGNNPCPSGANLIKGDRNDLSNIIKIKTIIGGGKTKKYKKHLRNKTKKSNKRRKR